MTKQLEDLSAAIVEEVSRKRAELRALETREFALRETIKELEGRVGDHMKNLQVKTEIDKIMGQLEAFARS